MSDRGFRVWDGVTGVADEVTGREGPTGLRGTDKRSFRKDSRLESGKPLCDPKNYWDLYGSFMSSVLLHHTDESVLRPLMSKIFPDID